MKMAQKFQRGFGVVELVLIVLAAGLIGGVGWWAYQHNRPKVSDAKDSGGSQSTKKPPADKDSKPTVAYLKIKEWGVKLPLSEEIKDAYYVVSTGSVDENGITNRILIGLKSLDKDGCLAEGNNRGEGSAIAAIFRALPTNIGEVSGKPVTEDYPNGVHIDGYYYAYQSLIRSTSCKAPQTILQTVDGAFTAKGKTITKSVD